MTSEHKKRTIALIVANLCCGVFVIGDIIVMSQSRGQVNLVVHVKDAFLGIMVVFGFGYALARLVLACIPSTTVVKAAKRGDLEGVTRLLEKGEQVDARDFWANTALSHAARLGNAPMVELLLKRGADPKVANYGGKRPKDLTEDGKILELLCGTPTQQGLNRERT